MGRPTPGPSRKPDRHPDRLVARRAGATARGGCQTPPVAWWGDQRPPVHPLAGFSAPVLVLHVVLSPPWRRPGWLAIASGGSTLILAPHRVGQTTLAAFSPASTGSCEPVPERERRTRLLYLSPALLAVDVEEETCGRRCRASPLAAERLGEFCPRPHRGHAHRHRPDERRQLVRHPPDVLITTPESLCLMLTSQARETRSVRR